MGLNFRKIKIMKTFRLGWILLFCICNVFLFGQSMTIEGYAYETGNRGYLNEVSVSLLDQYGAIIISDRTNSDGFFSFSVQAGVTGLKVLAEKDLFFPLEKEVEIKAGTEKAFVKLEMKRAPGYIFDITLAERRLEGAATTDGLKGALIEVYNNTTRKEIMVLKDYKEPDFKLNMLKGNHYTILIRKEGFLAKRMEAYVDVEGCILCFEGLGDVEPGVSDNLTEGNVTGTLLANVELEPLFIGQKIEFENIYYELGKWNITEEGKERLIRIGTFMKDNPRLNIELGSHTDSRGGDAFNKNLSQKRANSAVSYLRRTYDIPANRITSKGYGESQLINKCQDGVKCDEEEHAQNRRTELKILGLDQKEEVFKSLASMKRDENMDEILEELEEETVQVSAGDEMPEDLRRYIESQKQKSSDQNGNIKESVKVEHSQNVEIVETVIETIKEVNDVQIEEINPLMETELIQSEAALEAEVEKMMKAESTSKIVDSTVEERVNSIEEKVDSQVEKAKAYDANPQFHNDPIKTPAGTDQNLNDTSIEKEVFVKVIREEDTSANTVIHYPGYTGHKIVIHYTNRSLPETHEYYRKHVKLKEVKINDFYYYLIGDFQTKEEATLFMKSYVHREYPNAYVMHFQDGVKQ